MEKVGNKYRVIKAINNEYTVVKKATNDDKTQVLGEYMSKIEAMRNAVNLAKENPKEIEVIIRSDI